MTTDAGARLGQPCPYPGPRPLAYSQADRLVGRGEDISALVRAIEGRNRAVIVHAPSGIGKSSLLMAGLVPPLKRRGKTVLVFRNWSELDRDPLQALVRAFIGGFEDAGEAEMTDHATELRRCLNSGEGLASIFDAMDYLSARFGHDLVLVLDQMEEIFRLDRSFGLQFVDTLTQMLQPAEETHFKVILSLRSEFASELEPLERRLLRSLWDSRQLGPVVRREEIDDVVRLPRSKAEGWRFDECLAQQITRYWMLAAFDTAEDPDLTRVPKVGLLHLQAALWVLWHRATAGAERLNRSHELTGPVSADAVTVFVLESQSVASIAESTAAQLCLSDSSAEGEHWRLVFEGVLEEYVELSIQHHVDEVLSRLDQDPGLAEAVAAETKAHVARLAPQLSSGGYKVIADSDELAESVGVEVLPPVGARYFREIVRVAREEAKAIFLDGQAEGTEGARLRDVVHGKFGPDKVLAELEAQLKGTDRQVSAGRLRAQGATLAELICEMAVTHERAVRWLVDASVVRETPGLPDSHRQSTRFLSVVHDGYGGALKRWGLRTLNELESARFPLVAVRGEGPLETTPLEDAADGLQSVDDLIEGVHFSNLVWQGCDVARSFRRVTFEDCDLRGTVFVNCEFTDVTFKNCCLYGTIWMRSQFSGSFAVVSERSREPDLDLERQIRGLSIEQKCTFTPEASLVLRELWGSGLSVTETTCRHWELDYCGLENVLIQLDADGEDVTATGVIWDSVIHNLTVGNALIQRGTGAKNAAQSVALRAVRKGDRGGNIIRHLTLSPESAVSDEAEDRNSIKYVWKDRSLKEWGGD